MATMKECILGQASTMETVAQRMPVEVKNAITHVGTGFEKVYMVGSGTSLNAATTARYAFERYNTVEVRTVTPFDFLHYFPHQRLDNKTLVLGISQTARSIGTIEAVKLAKSRGARTLFVTAEPENPGANSGDCIFNTWTGHERVGAKTKGFTSTIAALCALAAGLAEKSLDLHPLAEVMDQVLKDTEQEISRWVEALLMVKALKLVSYGPAMGIAAEGALKITETVRIPVEYYDVEEYMHGPYHTLTPESHMLFLCPPGAGQERVAQLLSFVQTITPYTYLLTDASFAEQFRGRKLAIPTTGEEMLDCISYGIPLQWLANDITLRQGRKPEASAYPDFHKILGSKHMPKVNYYTGNEA